jgi:hypothetical protein
MTGKAYLTDKRLAAALAWIDKHPFTGGNLSIAETGAVLRDLACWRLAAARGVTRVRAETWREYLAAHGWRRDPEGPSWLTPDGAPPSAMGFAERVFLQDPAHALDLVAAVERRPGTAVLHDLLAMQEGEVASLIGNDGGRD